MSSLRLAAVLLLLGLFGTISNSNAASDRNRVPCYGERGQPQRCFPPFVNAAFNLPVEATNTCGQQGREEYCQQTGISGATKSCDYCDDRITNKSHPARYLTDFHSLESLTWWQSGTMLSNVQWPNSVNLTLRLGKTFEITYVRLKYHSSRPESFAIYKRTNDRSEWQPWQFYSSSCQETYNLNIRTLIQPGNEAQAICRDDFSDISPLTGASVAFSTLEGRPSAYDFENSPVLQEWVTATDIRIVLNRINTFRDEVFGDPNVLKSYFYAISDFAVGGRCKCNGHASKCEKRTEQNLEERLVCECEHNTTGADCGECLPFYNDQPWHRATAADAHECKPCSCNGLSNRCFFDEELYRKTGHGGHCLDCRDNTFGPNCERCRDNYFRRRTNDRCQPCNCHPVGSLTLQCNEIGTCQCKPGVTGEKCDRCQANFHDFGVNGCRQCQCDPAGSLNNRPDCNAATGQCTCKENVEGADCETCKSGFFALTAEDPQGCISCFCYGHSSTCTSSPGYMTSVIHSEFDSGSQKWKAEIQGGQEVPVEYNAITQSIGASTSTSNAVYFVAPERYHGDKRFSYGLYLTFTLRVGEEGSRPSVQDIILEGNGLRISTSIISQGNPAPRTIKQDYKFRLNEHSTYQWSPRLSATEFVRLLSNITAIKIRGTYGSQGVGFLDSVKLQSARVGSGGTPATNVEHCTCPEGYVGQFCESCAPGYRRDPPNGDSFARCIPCNCNRHSDHCEASTGRCICQHNTAGASCERCAPGYYGYALAGTPDDCKPCPCPDQGRCVQLLNGDVACIDCREGYTGHRCDQCLDGYFGDPEGRFGPRRPCTKCACNDNIDPNAVGNCNRTTGECLKCIYNTAGFNCERCLSTHYGSALALPKGQCKACGCYPPGTVTSGRPGQAVEQCEQQSGRCRCQPNVAGRQCNVCEEGYWNIDSGTGCERCTCDRIGAINSSCDVKTGSCYCKPGVGGKRCDQCMANYYSFSRDGCRACNCNPAGSQSLQCDQTGQCPCLPNIGGQQCDKCEENKYNLAAGCLDCPVCYNVVQEHVNLLRQKLNELRIIIENIGDNPTAIDDADFRNQLRTINQSVVKLWQDAKRFSGVDVSLSDQVAAIRAAIDDVISTCGHVSNDILDGQHVAQRASDQTIAAERALERAERTLDDAENRLRTEGRRALQEASDAQHRFGQQSDRMTTISREAREYADRQESESQNIEHTAREALNTSEEALRIAQSAIQKPGSIRIDVDILRRRVLEAEREYNETKALADRAHEKAQEAKADAFTVQTETELIRVTRVNIETLDRDSNQIKSEAEEIKRQADQLIDQHRSLLSDVERQKQEAARLMDNGEVQQQKADELLADADAARDMARKAVAKAEATLREANETLKTLKEFDQKVQDNRAEAEEALKKIPQIIDNINVAEQKTGDARRNLAGAEKDANDAKDIADEAQALAEKADQDSNTMRNKTRVIKVQTSTLIEESERLTIEIDDLERRLTELERQAEEDERLADEATKKAGDAEASAQEASSKVSQSLGTVEEILQQLSRMDRVDLTKLDELDRSLDTANRTLTENRIESRYNELETLNSQIDIWLTTYSTELEDLRIDVRRIDRINATIPQTCYRRITLEPTEPRVG